MIDLRTQENQREIKSLRALLKSVTPRQKQENEWKLLENDLMLRLEARQPHAARGLPVPAWLCRVPRFAVPVGVTAMLGLVVWFGPLLYDATRPALPLVDSRVTGVRGKATYAAPMNSRATPDRATMSPIVFAGQEFETASGATLIIRLDKRSALILSENTKLFVRRADARCIELFLDRGNILASVGKRRKNQPFSVGTPNGVCTVVGTVFGLTVVNGARGSTTKLAVLEGKVAFSSTTAEREVMVEAGSSAVLDAAGFSGAGAIAQDETPIHAMSILKQTTKADIDTTTGLLDVISEPPGARVTVHDEIVGTTPVVVRYPSGTHRVKLTSDGFEVWSATIQMEAGRMHFVVADLQRLPAAPGKTRRAPSRRRTRDRIGDTIRPEYVEALIQMTVGEYAKALVLLETLKGSSGISDAQKTEIIGSISSCYQGMGDFARALRVLEHRYRAERNETEKSNLLWQLATVKADCLADYDGARTLLRAYVADYPAGVWIEQARAKLADIDLVLRELSEATAPCAR